MSLLLLLGASAIAVDLAAMRLDRSADQKVTDSAASAGALTALEGDGQAACEAALEYVAINSEGIGSIDTSGCTSDISATCDPGTPESHSPLNTGRFDVTFIYPVTHGHALMTSAQLGAPSQTETPEDGDPCERVGVQMSATHTSFFAQLLGFDQGTTTVHSVATGFLPSLDGPPLNLLVLDRTGCDSILVEGGGSGVGGIVVDAVVDPDTGDLHPGVAAADSDANSGCTPSVIHATGNSLLRADGRPGCDDELATGPGHGCGLIQTFVQGITTCTTPACQIDGSNAVIAPEPTSLSARVTRQQIDHKYNCWTDYANPPAGTEWATSDLSAPLHNIDPCTTGDPDHIYDLINLVGQNGGIGGFQDWTQPPLNLPCDIPSSHGPINVSGDVRIDCDPLIVRNQTTITDGNVVFDGDVEVKASSSAHLTIQNPVTSSNWAFFRSGVLNKTGQANLTIDHTMVYLSETSSLTMSGGTGTMSWVAPDGGEFDDLALWSDSPATHLWAGQSTLVMEGVFFTPWATADYSGNGVVQNVDAQWVAYRLHTHGEGVLTIKPKYEFPVKLDDTARTTIIR